MLDNGPAVWGGCVTRRNLRPRFMNFSQKTVMKQGGYSEFFVVQVQILLRITSVAAQTISESEIYRGVEF